MIGIKYISTKIPFHFTAASSCSSCSVCALLLTPFLSRLRSTVILTILRNSLSVESFIASKWLFRIERLDCFPDPLANCSDLGCLNPLAYSANSPQNWTGNYDTLIISPIPPTSSMICLMNFLTKIQKTQLTGTEQVCLDGTNAIRSISAGSRKLTSTLIIDWWI